LEDYTETAQSLILGDCVAENRGASALLTLLLTPRIQHYFWGYQRMSELRLVAYKELNDLAADFLTRYINDQNYRPTDEFYKTLMVLTANIKTMVSEKAFATFKEFEQMLGPNLGPTRRGTIEKYISSRDQALRALYKEAVVAKRFRSVKINEN
jgi:hypothetical protein